MTELHELLDTTEQAQAPEPRYVVIAGPNGVHRITRADGSPLGTARQERPVTAAVAESEPPPSSSGWADDLRVEIATRRRALLQSEAERRRAALQRRAPTRGVLRAWRQARGWTQRTLADEAGVSRNLVAEIEAGRRNAPDTRIALAAALGHPEYAQEEPS